MSDNIWETMGRIERERDKWEETARLYCNNFEHHREMREKAERERDEAGKVGEAFMALAWNLEQNAKVRDIAERAIVVASMVSELYQQGYRPESLDQLCAELDQLTEEEK